PESEPEPAAPPLSPPLSPAVRKLVAEHDLDPAAIEGTGKDGRLLKADVEAHLAAQAAAAEQAAAPEPEPAPEPAPPPQAPPPKPAPKPAPAVEPLEAGEREVRVRMSRLRRRIAERLKEAQNTAAMLTTFNDADMGAILDLRKRYRDSFEKRHGVRLGFMSFFVKACIEALKEIPAVNAEIDGDDIVYKNYYDIGVAVGTEQGLVVPVLRDADGLSFADIERTIAELGARARDGALSMAELTGGTFTISNGGVYGSMLSTPILNPPQSGILGMHRIEQRPVARDGQVVIRPMMYLALSYDHRIVDGREAVTFLVKVKEGLEDPERLLLGV
ncbi:MAG: 2-oxoglutarate dehydrogenase complex dihydrolipoyllysine-residue succinyltransferase, partial [Rhodospirillaceae bacterium]|nr:2-oxoglutarate dehydrogenase complex dihydrolipoyllysine-residue succinyltransferase [Rhodospirillaceae bacterium]